VADKKGVHMDHICLAMPVLPGQSDAAQTFFKQLDTNRRAEFDASERRIGITKELWYLAKLPAGDHVIGYMEAQDLNRASRASSPHETRSTCGSSIRCWQSPD
jgi:hypothetical protein